MGSKDESTFRVVFHNVNCLPIDYRDPKSREAISQLYKSEADVYAMAEIGLNWGSLDARDQWYHRVRGHLPVKSSLANNKHQVATTRKQFGGVAVCVLGDSVHKVRSKGNDPTGLGRWTWALLEGKQHHLTRIVSVYRPSISSSEGEDTVDAQHTDYLRSNDDLRPPRQAIYEDLQTQINVWKANGENIIICIDANENILEGVTCQFFQENDMEEAILSTHPNKPSPATCNKNEHRVSIDGIFCTHGLIPVAAGYRPFHEGPKSDHRILWVDFVKKSVLGNESPRMKPPSARRLKTQDPRMIKKYNKQTHKAMLSRGLYKKLEEITTEAKSGWLPQLTEKYDALNKQKIECRSEVEKKMRKLKMGNVPWSPKIQECRTNIEIWILMSTYRRGKLVSLRKIRRLLVASKIQDAFQKTLPEIQDEIDKAFKIYLKAKKEDAVKWRYDFLHSLAEAKAIINKTSISSELKKLKQIDWVKNMSVNIKRV